MINAHPIEPKPKAIIIYEAPEVRDDPNFNQGLQEGYPPDLLQPAVAQFQAWQSSPITRSAVITLRWSDAPTLEGYTLVANLRSTTEDGTYLDPRVSIFSYPVAQMSVHPPTEEVYIRHYQYGGYSTRFYFGEKIVPNQIYAIRWDTITTTTPSDYATIELHAEAKMFNGCRWSICVIRNAASCIDAQAMDRLDMPGSEDFAHWLFCVTENAYLAFLPLITHSQTTQ